jgi:hypothetical protein
MTILNKIRYVLVTKAQARSCKHCCSGKAVSISYSEYLFIALIIQHAMRILHIVVCALLVVKYFSTLSHNRRDIRKTVIEQKM